MARNLNVRSETPRFQALSLRNKSRSMGNAIRPVQRISYRKRAPSVRHRYLESKVTHWLRYPSVGVVSGMFNTQSGTVASACCWAVLFKLVGWRSAVEAWMVQFAGLRRMRKRIREPELVISRGFKSGPRATRLEGHANALRVIYAPATIYEPFRGLSRAPIAEQHAPRCGSRLRRFLCTFLHAFEVRLLGSSYIGIELRSGNPFA